MGVGNADDCSSSFLDFDVSVALNVESQKSYSSIHYIFMPCRLKTYLIQLFQLKTFVVAEIYHC